MEFKSTLIVLLAVFLVTSCYAQTSNSTTGEITEMCSCEEVIKARCELQAVKKEMLAVQALADEINEPTTQPA
jgi:hypothetical protein